MDKICTKCGQTYPATTQFFPPRKPDRSRDGLDSWCKACHRTSASAYYKANMETINQKKRPYWNQRYRENRRLRSGTYPEIDALIETELAYIAGLIDGEGSLNILGNGPRKDRRLTDLTTSVTISMTHEETMQWLADKLGVACSVVRRKKHPTHRSQYKVALVGKRAIRLVQLIKPHMITKAGQATIVLAFGEVGYYHGGKMIDNPLTGDEIVARREELKAQIRQLNHGVASSV